MSKKYSYAIARNSTHLTGIIFINQFLIEMSGFVKRQPGYEWVLPACGFAFFLAITYSVCLIVINARKTTNGH